MFLFLIFLCPLLCPHIYMPISITWQIFLSVLGRSHTIFPNIHVRSYQYLSPNYIRTNPRHSQCAFSPFVYNLEIHSPTAISPPLFPKKKSIPQTISKTLSAIFRNTLFPNISNIRTHVRRTPFANSFPRHTFCPPPNTPLLHNREKYSAEYSIPLIFRTILSILQPYSPIYAILYKPFYSTQI